MKILASSIISHQPTFRNPGFSAEMIELSEPSQLIAPDYSVIPPMDRRRMSEVLKMGIACTVDCIAQSGDKSPDAIIVGTSMGCCTHTRSFLDKVLDSQSGLISPTSFILSTHNTIAGQISLHLKNHGYNNTHTQNSLSFEHALIDTITCEQLDGARHILVGAADEYEDVMYNMEVRLNKSPLHAGWGAAFFMLAPENSARPYVDLVAVDSFGLIEDIAPLIQEFLSKNELTINDIDMVMFSHSNSRTVDSLARLFGRERLFDYQKWCGIWFTNSGFAMGLAVDVLRLGSYPNWPNPIHRVIICNNLVPENLGLILLEKKS